ncbi:MAG: hypothetical protein ACREOG_20640 [Gemmatimonadaceae bacterium]
MTSTSLVVCGGGGGTSLGQLRVASATIKRAMSGGRGKSLGARAPVMAAAGKEPAHE